MDFSIAEICSVFNSQEGKDNCQKQVLKLIQFLGSEEGWPLCTSVLLNSDSNLSNVDALPEEQKSALFFLCCRAIEEGLKSSLPVQPDEAPKFAAFACEWLRCLINPADGIRKPKYFEAKAGQLISLAIVRYFPNHWSSLFDDLLTILIEATGKQAGATNKSDVVAVDLFLDILIDLDSYIISRNVQLTTEELKRSNELKDAMRESCVGSLIHTCYQLIHRFLDSCQSNAFLIRKILHTIGLYASWVDLTLVANAEWITLLSRLLQLSVDNSSSAIIRCGLYSCLVGFVNKGMPVVDKLRLLTGIWEQLGTMLLNDPSISSFMNHTDTTDNGDNNLNDDQLESLSTLATLIDAMGIQLLSVYRSLYDANSPTANCTQASSQLRSNCDTNSCLPIALEALEDRLNVALRLFEHKERQVSQVLMPFLRSYLSLLKSVANPSENMLSPGRRRQRNRNSSASLDLPSSTWASTTTTTTAAPGHLEINEMRSFYVKRLLYACVDKMKCLPIRDDQEDDESEYEEYRHELRTLIGNITQLDPRFVLDTIHQMVRHSYHLLCSRDAKKSSLTLEYLQQIDVTLNLFYLFGETCKASKNDHFAQSFPLHESMISIMSTLCTDSFSHLPHEVLQLQYFEVMARYERYFALVPEHLFHVMLAFVDDRGLHSPWHSVRLRCAYLINRIIKSHRKALLPHTEEYLSRFTDLLELSLEPDYSVLNSEANESIGFLNGNTVHIGKSGSTGLGITEQGFLYEAAAQLIAAGGGGGNVQLPVSTDNANGEDRIGELFRVLLTPVMIQYDQFVTKYISEQNPKIAEVRGILVKQVTDLITRTTRVFSQSKSVMTSGCQAVLIDAMRLIISELSRFPTEAASPGRQAACTGVRAFLHRMVACIMPTSEPGSVAPENSVTSDILLAALIDAIPQLVKPLRSGTSCYNGDQVSDVMDAEQRWKEIRDVIPLVTQVVLRYKNQSIPFLSTCLPGLLEAIMSAVNEPLPPDHPTLFEERKLLRRGYLQLVQSIYQSVPDVFSQLISENIVQNLSTVLGQVQACLESDDPIGLRSGVVLFLQLIQSAGHDSHFYEDFLLSHFIPFCIIAPISPTFRTTDGQFILVLDKISECLHILSEKQSFYARFH
ncbi:unnamed protein product [Heterobilharzia americana]|nr:unnamed protein product [Heterobilharzia americana]